MTIDLKPGTTVRVTYKQPATNEAAGKTLARVWLFDPANKRYADKRENTILEYRGWGGRIKPVRIRGSALRTPKVGQSCQFKLTSGRLADLRSVHRFVDVIAV